MDSHIDWLSILSLIVISFIAMRLMLFNGFNLELTWFREEMSQ